MFNAENTHLDSIVPSYDIDVPNLPATTFTGSDGIQWYAPVMIGASQITDGLFSGEGVRRAKQLLEQLSPDDYSVYLSEFYRNGSERFGTTWRYADIVTVLIQLARLLQPRTYLEIGIRRGRSVAAVASESQDCALVMLDSWVADYAGMSNPGPEFVRAELRKVKHRGTQIFIDGDSHVTLPEFFRENPTTSFDLITVDGDHSREGAAMDLATVLPRLNIGGAVVFDDIAHPLHPWMAELWRDLVVRDTRYSSFSYDDAGYGVGFAIRKF